MSAEHTLLRATVRALLESRCEPAVVDLPTGPAATELWRLLEEHGLTSVGVPEQAGGTGGSLHDAAVILETAARFAALVPLAETLCAGWLHTQIGLAAPRGPLGAAFDPAGQLEETTAGWRLQAQVPRVPFGRQTTRLLVVVPRPGQLAIAQVDPARGDVVAGQNLAAEPRDDLTFDIELGTDEVVFTTDPLGDHLRLLQALTKAVQLAGAADEVSAMTVRYTAEREQFGRPIAAFQAVQQQLAEMAGEVAVMRAAADAAVAVWEAHGPASSRAEVAVASAKAQTNSSATRVAAIAHQLHGAMGFTREHRLRLLTTRLWSWSDEAGDESYWARYLGERVLAHDPVDVWNLVEDA